MTASSKATDESAFSHGNHAIYLLKAVQDKKDAFCGALAIVLP